jgi:glycosyltransferase involved in cell wall biosynthesis
MPLVSVIVPAFNEEKFLGNCLESLENQDFKDFEIIVVDNNSTDKTAEIAKKFGVILVSEKNQGVAFARNKGANAAKGEILVFTDADTILPKNWLSRIQKEFEKDKKFVAFGGSCQFYSGPISARLASKFLLKPFLIFDKFFSGGWNLMGCNMAIRKEAFFKIGGFNTNLKLNEEIEISSRLRKVGKVILDPNFKVKTSGRRYRHGLVFGMMDYIPSTFFRLIFRKYDKFQRFPAVREEESLVGKFSFPMISLFVFLFLLYHLSTPKITVAKTLIKKDLNKTLFMERRIKNEIKNDFRELKNFPHLRRWAK